MNKVPAHGNITKKVINAYIKYLIKKGILYDFDIYNNKIRSLYFSKNKEERLYFWQLYSILGEDVITKLITDFYRKILSDSEHLWFSDVFRKSGPLMYHVIGQKRFWMECMGGGDYYNKHGKKTLYNKHYKVKDIMTMKGAVMWMRFMNETLDESEELQKIDERVIPCIKDFLDFFMKKYSRQFFFRYSKL